MQHLFLRKLAIAAFFCLGLATVLYADDVVMTNYILNPSFESGTDSWNVSNLSQQSNTTFKMKQGKIYLEKWTDRGSKVGSASATQKLTGLPAGNYRVVAGAHNIQQTKEGDATGDGTEQTGAIIFAIKTSNSTKVTVPADYEVTFNTSGTDVTIGFRAVNASGNWICVDNFRLFYTGADYISLQTAISNAETIMTDSEGASYAGIQPAIKNAFQTAINAAKTATESTLEADLREMSFELAEKQALAKRNMNQLRSLKSLLNSATSLLDIEMVPMYKAALNTAYEVALKILNLETDDSAEEAYENLDLACKNAEANNAAINTLKTKVSNSETLLDKDMATVYKTELQTAYDIAIEFLKLEKDDDVQLVIKQLTDAYDMANASYEAKTALNTSINAATTLLDNASIV